MKIQFYCALVLLLAPVSHALFKRWIRNVNYNNPGNWNLGRLPCANDNVTIPESSPVVYLQHDTALLELVLPMNGEIVLGDSLSLSFGPSEGPVRLGHDQDPSKTSPVCRGADINFNRTRPASWFDPENWCTSETEDSACLVASVIDAERIPCQHDDVIFPKGATYHVDMDTSDDITVGRLKIRGKLYTEPSWDVFIRSGGGDKEFTRTRGSRLPNLKIKGEICDDVTGCRCGTDDLKILHKICALQKRRCPPLACIKPLQPKGACCRLCGSQLSIEYGIGFSIDHLRKLIKDQLMPANATMYSEAGVKYSVSKLSPGVVQVVVSDSGDGSAAQYLANELNSFVMNDIEQNHIYSVKTVTMRKSEIPPKVSPRTGARLDTSIIVAIVVSIILLLIIVILLVIYVYKRRRSRFFEFSRFFGSSKSRDMELTTPTVSYVDVIGGEAGGGFDNPLYGSSPLGKDAMDFYQDPSVKFNPTFTSDGIDQDSSI